MIVFLAVADVIRFVMQVIMRKASGGWSNESRWKSRYVHMWTNFRLAKKGDRKFVPWFNPSVLNYLHFS